MAAADTDKPEPSDIKRKARRRLVGAIALVVFVVIALPLVLDRDPKPISQDLSVQIPSQDSGKFNNRVDPPAPVAEAPKAPESAPVPQTAPAGPSAAAPLSGAAGAATTAKALAAAPAPQAIAAPKAVEAPPVPAPAPAPAKAEPAKQEPAAAKAVPAKEAAPKQAAAKSTAAQEAPKAAAAPKAPAVADGQGFMVPLGAYTNAANVRQQLAKAKAAGVDGYSEALKTDKGEQTRVRAGPFATREAAERARERLIQAGVKPVGNVTAR